MAWRTEPDGRLRIAYELLNEDLQRFSPEPSVVNCGPEQSRGLVTLTSQQVGKVLVDDLQHQSVEVVARNAAFDKNLTARRSKGVGSARDREQEAVAACWTSEPQLTAAGEVSRRVAKTRIEGERAGDVDVADHARESSLVKRAVNDDLVPDGFDRGAEVEKRDLRLTLVQDQSALSAGRRHCVLWPVRGQ